MLSDIQFKIFNKHNRVNSFSYSKEGGEAAFLIYDDNYPTVISLSDASAQIYNADMCLLGCLSEKQIKLFLQDCREELIQPG